jgi:hypothetical protein
MSKMTTTGMAGTNGHARVGSRSGIRHRSRAAAASTAETSYGTQW